jgi:hypothetical protein
MEKDGESMDGGARRVAALLGIMSSMIYILLVHRYMYVPTSSYLDYLPN